MLQTLAFSSIGNVLRVEPAFQLAGSRHSCSGIDTPREAMHWYLFQTLLNEKQLRILEYCTLRYQKEVLEPQSFIENVGRQLRI